MRVAKINLETVPSLQDGTVLLIEYNNKIRTYAKIYNKKLYDDTNRELDFKRVIVNNVYVVDTTCNCDDVTLKGVESLFTNFSVQQPRRLACVSEEH